MNKIPNLTLGEFGFEGTVKLTSWTEFQSRNGAYGSQDNNENFDGSCNVSTGGDMVVDDYYLIENQESIKDSILDYLLNSYPDLQEQYGYDEEEKFEFMPDVKTKEEFK